jgi:molecular chaperone DnaK
MEQLNTAWSAASQEMYAASQAQEGQPAPDGASQAGAPKDSEVTDVDFEEVKDTK